MHWRTQVKMPREESWLDICPMQFAPHESRGRAVPDRVLNIHDRRHQRHETKIALHHRQKGADPSAITSPEHTKLVAAALAQYCHQFPQLDYALTQPPCVADEIGRDGELPSPMAARDT